MLSFVPGGRIVYDATVRSIDQFAPTSPDTQEPLPNFEQQLVALRTDQDTARQALQTTLTDLRSNMETAVQTVAEQLDETTGQSLIVIGKSIQEAARVVEERLTLIDQNTSAINQNLTDIETTLGNIQQFLHDLTVEIDNIDDDLQEVKSLLFAQSTAMDRLLNNAQESHATLRSVETNLDTLANAMAVAFLLNLALISLMLFLVLRLERSMRYAIDLLKIMLVEFKIPVPDPPLGPFGRVRVWCHTRPYWRWLPHATVLTTTTLAAVLVTAIILLLIDPTYLNADGRVSDVSSAAAPGHWRPLLTMAIGTAAFLATRRLRQSDRLGPPVLAFAPVEDASPNSPGTILIRDNGLRSPDGGFVIGRHASLVDVVVRRGSISRRHARVTQDPSGQFYIEDLHSTSAVRVNGTLLQPFVPHAFTIEDRVQLGDLTLSVQPLR